MIVIDNYDSFTFNLVQQIEEISGCAVEVMRNDAFDVNQVIASTPDAIFISPGPGTPSKAGKIVELIRAIDGIPLLGVCLGHQAIGEAFGARVVRAPLPVHGKTAEIEHRGSGLFAGAPQPFTATRYHSLVVDRASLPEELEIDATAGDLVMAMHHKTKPIWGIQFHPESYGTASGALLIRNFLALGGIS